MFWYISFVRPPPILARGAVTISIQVANDLRTQICNDEYDIYGAWVSSDGNTVGSARKITRWRPGLENKLLELPLPMIIDNQGYRPLPAVRLSLWAGVTKDMTPDNSHDTIALLDPSFGRIPFPVMSLPIQLASPPSQPKLRGGPKVQKQEQIERKLQPSAKPEEFDSPSAPGYLILREDTSYDLDKKVWDSGLGLSSWLSLLCGSSDLSPTLHNIATRLLKRFNQDSVLRVIELGCGSGLVSLVLAALLQGMRGGKETYILATDLESAMPLINHNFSQNEGLYRSISLTSEALDWEDDHTLLASKFELGHDVILLADVTYNTVMFPALLRTLDALVHTVVASSGGDTLLILAYKERDAAERTLFILAIAVDIRFELVTTIAGAGGNPIEIYIAVVSG